MPRTPKDVTDAELAALQVLWRQGHASRRQITDELYPEGGPAHYTTVQKLLERLQAKGFVQRERQEGILIFRATMDREALISRRLRDVADKLCGGSLTPLLLNLVRRESLTERELQELHDLVEELSRQGRRKSGRR
jgi:predicted transcriptional regulator